MGSFDEWKRSEDEPEAKPSREGHSSLSHISRPRSGLAASLPSYKYNLVGCASRGIVHCLSSRGRQGDVRSFFSQCI
jgi:hypothetical protein